MIEKYESKQVQIRRTAAEIYAALADFNNFTPLVEGRVDDWRVDGDECSFRVKGFRVALRMVERVEPTLVKIEATDASPLGFTFWVQLVEAGRNADGETASAPFLPDTRLRLTLHAEMNMMVRMMVGARIQPALDSIADSIALMFG